MEVICICLALYSSFLVCGLWLAGFRVVGVVVAALLTLQLLMQSMNLGLTYLFKDDLDGYFLAYELVSLAFGLLTSWYAIVIMGHMVFSKEMPWADKNNTQSESES